MKEIYTFWSNQDRYFLAISPDDILRIRVFRGILIYFQEIDILYSGKCPRHVLTNIICTWSFRHSIRLFLKDNFMASFFWRFIVD